MLTNFTLEPKFWSFVPKFWQILTFKNQNFDKFDKFDFETKILSLKNQNVGKFHLKTEILIFSTQILTNFNL